jgi:hypothetical protein
MSTSPPDLLSGANEDSREEQPGDEVLSLTPLFYSDGSASTSHTILGVSLPRLAPRLPPPPSQPSGGTKSLGDITLTDEETEAYFQEYSSQYFFETGYAHTLYRFFQYYHPFYPILPEPVEPQATFVRSNLLFWAICSVGCRPRPDHPVLRARSSDLTMALAEGVRQLIAMLMVSTQHSVAQIQGLLVLCQWPFTTTQKGSITTAWVCR